MIITSLLDTDLQLTANPAYLSRVIRKGIIFVILCSMQLHCASRIGFLSYLYTQRQEIAYSLGLISEIPIAMCSSDYDFQDGLVVHASQGDAATRQTLPMALEIKLFFSAFDMPVIIPETVASVKYDAPVGSRPLSGCLQSIFHPPALQS